MTLFEFLMAIASVVIAIALTEIFGGWGELLRTHIAPSLDWLHLAWSIVVVLYAIQYWTGIWPYREVDFSAIYQVWLLIIPTLFIVLVAFAITPNISPEADMNLREYYLSRRAPIFWEMAVFVTTAQIADYVILGLPFTWVGAALGLLLIGPAFSQKIWIHTAIMATNLLFLVSNAFTPSLFLS